MKTMKTRRRWIGFWAALAMTSAAGVLGVGTLALAEDDEDEDEDEDGDGLDGSPGEATAANLRAPCSMSRTGVLGREVVVGFLHGQVKADGTRTPLPVSYFDGDRCGYGDLVDNNVSGDFSARLTSWYAMDRSTTFTSDIDLTWHMWKHTNNSNCSLMSPIDLGTKTGGAAYPTAATREWNEDGRFDISQRFPLNAPAANTYDSYNFVLTVTVATGAGSSTLSDTGCFAVGNF